MHKEETSLEKPATTESTPYDDVFRTLMQDGRQLLIPVLNDMFHKNYARDEKIVFYNNEFFITREGGKQRERITDSNFSVGEDRYHLECQSKPDGTMALRMFEYDVQIAVEDAELSKNELDVRFPNSGVVFLRSTKNTPDSYHITIHVPGDSCSYSVPVVKIRDYSLEDIFKKNLLFFIPFYIFQYGGRMTKVNSSPELLKALEEEYTEIRMRLRKLVEAGKLSILEETLIVDMTAKVVKNFAKNSRNIKERVGDVMGGKVITDYPSKLIYNEGFRDGEAKGETKGEANGIIKTLKSLVDQKLITVSQAAKQLGVSESKFLTL